MKFRLKNTILANKKANSQTDKQETKKPLGLSVIKPKLDNNVLNYYILLGQVCNYHLKLENILNRLRSAFASFNITQTDWIKNTDTKISIDWSHINEWRIIANYKEDKIVILEVLNKLEPLNSNALSDLQLEYYLKQFDKIIAQINDNIYELLRDDILINSFKTKTLNKYYFKKLRKNIIKNR